MVKGHILYWGDAPTVHTGFGVVARHVLGALFDAGYEISCLGINTIPDFVDRSVYPYDIVSAAALNDDPHGYRVLMRVLGAHTYDALFIQNDVHIGHAAAGYLRTLASRGVKLPPIIYYYPVDCGVRRNLTGMLELADVIATCTTYGWRETEAAGKSRAPVVIPHGVDSQAFRPLADRQGVREAFRRKLNLPADAQLICSVGANSARKDLARTIAAFAELRRAAPGRASALYLHTMPADNGLDLNEAVAACGLAVGRDVIFPAGYHPMRGLSDDGLNQVYNAADLYFTTTLGEGWGLPITEAMAAGLAVVAPRHSSLQELGGDGRAVLYECRERVWVDNSGYRPFGRMDDIVAALARVASLPDLERRRMTEAAREFAKGLDWTNVVPRWVTLFDDLLAARRAPQAAEAPGA